MKRTLPIVVAVIMLFSFVSSYAQSGGEIRGTVKDRNGENITGARIVVTPKAGGAKRGAIANSQGVFVLSNLAAGEYDISASAVSFKEMKRTVTVQSGSLTVDFTLQNSVSRTEEVVVTGQGVATERKRLTTTVESISAKTIEAAPVNTIDQLVQGRVPGLSAFMPGGAPGGGARMATRGIKSALTTSNPVIYVDGVRVDGADNFRLGPAGGGGTGGLASSALNDIVIGDVERVEVIKGGAGSTLYGAEAANGIIQIFTKKGNPGEAKWRFSTQQGFDAPETKFIQEAETKKYVLQTGYAQQYALNASGGTTFMTYNVSGRMFSNDGIVARNSLAQQQYQFNIGLSAKASEQLTIDLTAGYTRNQFKRIGLNNGTSPLNDIEGESLFQPYSGNPNLANKDSVMDLYFTPDINEKVNRLTGSLNVTYRPVPEFTNKFTVGVDYRNSAERQIFGINSNPVYGAPEFIQLLTRDFATITMQYNATYTFPKSEVLDHSITVGAQGFRVEDNETVAVGSVFAVPTQRVDQSSRQTFNESPRQLFNGGAYLNYKLALFDKVFVDIGGRYDVSSTFGDQVTGQFFPKASAAWNLADDLFPDSFKSIINGFKIRASWGQTGNFPPPFTRDRQYSVFAYRDSPIIDFAEPGNRALQPERTTSIEAGADIALFEDRFSIIFDYFNQRTTGALFSKPNDPPTGLGDAQANIGLISNEGVEVALNGILVQEENVEVSIKASVATLRNRAESLGGSAPFAIGGFAFAQLRLEEGHPVGVFRVNVPIPDTVGANAGQLRGLVRSNVLMGTPVPTLTGSVGFDVTLFKNLTLSVFGDFAAGHQVLNQARSRRIVNALAFREINNGITTYPVYPDAAALVPKNETTGAPFYDRNTSSRLLLQDADWFKLREVSLRYRFAEVLKGLTLSLTGRNLWIITKANVDPETSFIRAGGRGGTGNTVDVGGIAGATLSNPIQFRLGVDIAW
ncbi:MAG: TonB-dependent receptor [Candidatus Kapabacteria bacterium]|nr:TonB-dependent receptor [Candidatus Kapabacteria bacterium]